jgi:hypothetical protein
MKSKCKWLLGVVLLVALIFRFYAFRESTYFGYDQARDAFESQDIYVNRNIKILGAPVTGDIGLYHGPLYWYITGPIYLLFQGNPYGVSAFYRVVNALGILLVFVIADKIAGRKVGIISAFLYAISFEETQYSFYVGNPSLGVIFIPLIYLGALLIYKKSKYRSLSLTLMFGGAAAATQMNLMFAYNFGVAILLLIVLRKQIKELTRSAWVAGFFSTLLILSTYIMAEFKYNFRSVKTVIGLLGSGYGVMEAGQSKYLLFGNKYLTLFKDNILAIFPNNSFVVVVIALIISAWVIYQSICKIEYKILLIWIFSWVLLMVLGGHTGYYTNAGIGIGVIIGISSFLVNISNARPTFFVPIVLAFFVFTNGIKVVGQSPNSLIMEMITQTGMKLSDEYLVIDKMYQEANGNSFTVRETGIPYKVQTVWAYLFKQYALPKYGYLPVWENGNTLGFPGELPVPANGTTCVRFLLREPTWGLPQSLIDSDAEEENKFSKVITSEEIGGFSLEYRQSTDKVCR